MRREGWSMEILIHKKLAETQRKDENRNEKKLKKLLKIREEGTY